MVFAAPAVHVGQGGGYNRGWHSLATGACAVAANGHDTIGTPRRQPQAASVDRLRLRDPAGRFVYASGARPLAGYTIKRGVGQGGFGEIYYAISDAGKDVALKLIRRNLDVELRGIRQCLNLKHPNLLDLYDIRQDDQGDTWVVMEYVADQSLEDVLAAQPQRPAARTRRWPGSTASAPAWPICTTTASSTAT